MQKRDKIEAILKIDKLNDKLTQKSYNNPKRNLNLNHKKSVFENLVSSKSPSNEKVSNQSLGNIFVEPNKYSKNRSKSSDQKSFVSKIPETPVTDLKRVQRNQVKFLNQLKLKMLN